MREYISLSKAAKYLGVHLATAYRYAFKGKRNVVLKTYLVGKTRRTTWPAIRRFIRELSNQPTRPPHRQAEQSVRSAEQAGQRLRATVFARRK